MPSDAAAAWVKLVGLSSVVHVELSYDPADGGWCCCWGDARGRMIVHRTSTVSLEAAIADAYTAAEEMLQKQHYAASARLAQLRRSGEDPSFLVVRSGKDAAP